MMARFKRPNSGEIKTEHLSQAGTASQVTITKAEGGYVVEKNRRSKSSEVEPFIFEDLEETLTFVWNVLADEPALMPGGYTPEQEVVEE